MVTHDSNLQCIYSGKCALTVLTNHEIQCLRKLTFIVVGGAVRTEVLLVVPGQVPGLSSSNAAAFTANASHANLYLIMSKTATILT